jgi:hypothetical protein
VDHDLEAICLKCLQKDPARRYASAAALADDLRRWPAGRPLRARPAGVPEHFLRYFDTNPLVLPFLMSLCIYRLAGLQDALFVGTAFLAIRLPARAPSWRSALILSIVGTLLAGARAQNTGVWQLLTSEKSPAVIVMAAYDHGIVRAYVCGAVLGLWTAFGLAAIMELGRDGRQLLDWYRRALVALIGGAAFVALPGEILRVAFPVLRPSEDVIAVLLQVVVVAVALLLCIGVLALFGALAGPMKTIFANYAPGLYSFASSQVAIGLIVTPLLLLFFLVLFFPWILLAWSADQAPSSPVREAGLFDRTGARVAALFGKGLNVDDALNWVSTHVLTGLAAVLLAVSSGVLLGWLQRGAEKSRSPRPRAVAAGFLFAAALASILVSLRLPPVGRVSEMGKALVPGDGDTVCWPALALAKLLLLSFPPAVAGLAGAFVTARITGWVPPRGWRRDRWLKNRERLDRKRRLQQTREAMSREAAERSKQRRPD